MTSILTYYQAKFSPKSKSNKIGLNVSRSSGVAPNKPILLLSIIELAERGKLLNNHIELTPDLIATFLKFYQDLGIARTPNIGLPFFHLRSDGFWHFQAKAGFKFVESKQSQIKVRTIKSLCEAVQYAYLDEELFSLLCHQEAREVLKITLLHTWFPENIQQILDSLQLDAFEQLTNNLKVTGGRIYDKDEIDQEDEQNTIVRSATFRKTINSLYDYRCAFCGLQIFNLLDTIVDAAHIKPFSQFFDDRICNGLSLCKNHHWAFDRFWFTINDDYTICVRESLQENSPDARAMKELNGIQIWLPSSEQYRPSQENLAWHRQAFLEKLG